MIKASDLFAGLGGSSTGAEMAGAEVVWAGNHWPAAVEAHKANHPGAIHVCQDLHQADWSLMPRHDLMMASPCCQGHSKARGKRRVTRSMTPVAPRRGRWCLLPSTTKCRR